ncbi:MAG: hypothetical protein HY979_01705 [Candidatus Magasanikbacteria bacterium]|nr:hypothetical protein [Candidatus Magasanikbacteria bacterium]
MKKIFYLISLIAPMILTAPVLAAGGGGGGSFFSPAPAVETTPAPSPTSTVATATPALITPTTTSTSPTKTILCEQSTLEERVSCRLGLTEDQQREQLGIIYFPEECRVLIGEKQTACVNRYRLVQPCWEKPIGPSRSACASKVLGIKNNPAPEFRACLRKKSDQRASCQADVRDKVYALIKFRLYDLSERAESLLEKGIAKEKIVKLVSTMEQKKQAFNEAPSYQARRQILLDAQKTWHDFTASVKGVSKADYLSAALADLKSTK